MSELFMECEEEELEPWQRAIPEISLIDDDDDDEPIFVGEICSSKPTLNSRPTVGNQTNATFQRPSTMTSPQKSVQVQMNSAKQPAAPQLTVRGSSQSTGSSVLIPVSSPSGPLQAPRTLNTVSPQPIIINKQGYIVASPQNLNNNSTFITSLGSQYPPGTSFTVLPAAGQQIVQQVPAKPKPVPGVIHRPQVQLIQNNVVTLSNVQGPAEIPAQSHSASNLQSIQLIPQSKPSIMGPSKQMTPTLQAVNNRDNGKMKRIILPETNNGTSKRTKIDTENETPLSRKCPKCHIHFNFMDPLKSHMRSCCPHLLDTTFPSTSKPDNKTSAPARMYDMERGKLIMLVSDFYYGKCEGDQSVTREQKSNTTFKCNSCLKTLKNNIRFMNHMKHHLELEKQNSESWESHTTCQHCYRQYSTPFQLQCHIESAHSPYESTTNCKICELAFETEQVLLEHMKDNHKPGEMPYGCQVCNYRSSFFSDVETHFRTVHENTKDLLCPFCLKVLRSGHMYMQHYMKHQKKGIQRCGKCRLNFLTYKEKVEHKTLYHRTYKKPRSLEGLPPGTKVTIRASLTGGSPMSPGAPGKSYVNLVPTSAETAKPVTHKNSYMGRAKTNPTNKNRTSPHNHELKGLKLTPGVHKCTECQSEVTDPYVHYPLSLKCSVCKYRTSCQKSFGQHMLRFHSSSSKQRLAKVKRPLRGVRSLTLVCLNCEFLADATNTDRMCEHLLSRPNHTCQIILETDEESAVERRAVTDSDTAGALALIEVVSCSDRSVGTKEDSSQELPVKSGSNDIEPLIAEVWSEEPEFQPGEKEMEECDDDPIENGEKPAQAGDQEAEGKTEEAAETIESTAKDGCDVEAAEDAPPALDTGASLSSTGSEADGATVTVDDFLNKTDKAESVSVHSPLEPLTPSKVLECDAVENVQETKEDSSPNHETKVEEEPSDSGPDNPLEPSVSE
ncbi:zinc finger protein 280C isoform X1 [Pygocentrus nattereri]|uniref:C2H2-type domain-containing protein n=1 Tax=Pygocentrus nattereri TaxID=42514 RepID=A0A3B4EAT1_PYGNA|nr:zinc finger protein 280C isoform X1 [Pygocentrus nattereri]